jgi:hypothetical protein
VLICIGPYWSLLVPIGPYWSLCWRLKPKPSMNRGWVQPIVLIFNRYLLVPIGPFGPYSSQLVPIGRMLEAETKTVHESRMGAINRADMYWPLLVPGPYWTLLVPMLEAETKTVHESRMGAANRAYIQWVPTGPHGSLLVPIDPYWSLLVGCWRLKPKPSMNRG